MLVANLEAKDSLKLCQETEWLYLGIAYLVWGSLQILQPTNT